MALPTTRVVLQRGANSGGRRDKQREPLAFTGRLRAEATTKGKRPRWVELRIYDVEQPASALFVLEEVAQTTVDGEEPRHKAWACVDEYQLRKRAGTGRLATYLYGLAGFTEEIR